LGLNKDLAFNESCTEGVLLTVARWYAVNVQQGNCHSRTTKVVIIKFVTTAMPSYNNQRPTRRLWVRRRCAARHRVFFRWAGNLHVRSNTHFQFLF